jgi:hypothetical protein
MLTQFLVDPRSSQISVGRKGVSSRKEEFRSGQSRLLIIVTRASDKLLDGAKPDSFHNSMLLCKWSGAIAHQTS